MKITQHLLERKFLYLAVLWSVIILYLCLVSIKGTPSLVSIPNKDKIVHFIFYFVLFYFWKKALNVYEFKRQLKLVLILVVYGIIIEVFQWMFTKDRHADIYDVIANALGAVTALVFLRFVNK
ncbi:MAG: hypothetical protein CMP76_01925 [Flavobacterium sp.]|uniref:VanZ family protein n=1 Tax=unclassified Flavobacterium TaxID=196869 RepID=UPI000C49CC3B|nr:MULTISPECIES: VanZ family protein [unclassified Flavobacterium]MBF02032.1 hypothetical protein [Flavobacterium sp.]